MRARRALRARGHIGHVEHVGYMDTWVCWARLLAGSFFLYLDQIHAPNELQTQTPTRS